MHWASLVAHGKELACNVELSLTWDGHSVGKVPWRKAWQPTPVFLPGESPGRRSLPGYSPWCRRVRHD